MAQFFLDIEDGVSIGFDNYKKAATIAARNTLNQMAALTRRNAVRNVSDNFFLRNDFTTKSIKFKKTDSSILKTMKSRAGALKRAPYMKLQEKGGKRPDPDGRTAIPQKASRVGQSRLRLVSNKFYMREIKGKIVKGEGRKFGKGKKRGYAVAQMFVAHEKKLFIKRRNNIYKVKSIFSKGGRVNARLIHIYNIQTKPIFVPPEPWLLPATKKPVRDGPNLFKVNLKKLWKDGEII